MDISPEDRQQILREDLIKRGKKGGANTLKNNGTSFFKKIGEKGRAAQKKGSKRLAKKEK